MYDKMNKNIFMVEWRRGSRKISRRLKPAFNRGHFQARLTWLLAVVVKQGAEDRIYCPRPTQAGESSRITQDSQIWDSNVIRKKKIKFIPPQGTAQELISLKLETKYGKKGKYPLKSHNRKSSPKQIGILNLPYRGSPVYQAGNLV